LNLELNEVAIALVAGPVIDFNCPRNKLLLKNPTPFLHVQSITPLLVTPATDCTNFLQRLLQSFLPRLLQSSSLTARIPLVRHLKKTEESVKKGKFRQFRQFREKKLKGACESNKEKNGTKLPYLEEKKTFQIAIFRALSLVSSMWRNKSGVSKNNSPLLALMICSQIWLNGSSR